MLKLYTLEGSSNYSIKGGHVALSHDVTVTIQSATPSMRYQLTLFATHVQAALVQASNGRWARGTALRHHNCRPEDEDVTCLPLLLA